MALALLLLNLTFWVLQVILIGGKLLKVTWVPVVLASTAHAASNTIKASSTVLSRRAA